jgi:hypothetical protein
VTVGPDDAVVGVTDVEVDVTVVGVTVTAGVLVRVGVALGVPPPLSLLS